MTYNSICISSGHGKYIRGASGSPVPPQLDEVDEARKVVDRVAQELRQRSVTVDVFHDNTSHDQNTNLNTIVNHHNAQTRQLDISVHFNASDSHTGHGTEVFYVTQEALAKELSAAISEAGHTTDRGPKYSNNLFFLNKTAKPAVLIEVVFCDNTGDSNLYNQHFDAICAAIVDTLSEDSGGVAIPPSDSHKITGKVSHFGGPDDAGVSPDEGLAFVYDVMDAPHLFLPYQPEGTTGLARRLNPHVHYIACRWNYDETPKEMLLLSRALVTATRTGISLKAFPADWGPHQDTDRVADLSPGLMDDLGIITDDEVEVIFPYEEENLL